MSPRSLYVPPAPGMIASRVSGNPTTAEEAKMRKVVARASSRPPPRAMEETALMVGIGRWERVERVWRRVVRKWFVLEGELVG